MSRILRMWGPVVVGAVLAAAQAGEGPGNASFAAPTRTLGPHEVWAVEIMSRKSFGGVAITSLYEKVAESEKDMFYQTRKRLNFGKPSATASLCLWFYLKSRRYTDIIWVLGQADTSSVIGFNFVGLGVFSKNLSLQTNTCSNRYNYFVKRRKWIHLCVTMGDEVVTYADGEVIEPAEPCSFNGTSGITTNQSMLILGSDGGRGKPTACKVADARLYLTDITSEEVKSAMTFSNSTLKYIDIIEDQHNMPVGINIEPIWKEDLTTAQSAYELMHISLALTSNETENACEKVGGSLLDTESTNDAEIVQFVLEVSGELVSNFWVKPQNDSSCFAISVSLSGVIPEPPSDCSFLRRSICSFPRSTKFSFIGEKSSDNILRIPVEKVSDSLVWEAEYDYQLEYSESDYVMYLMNPKTWEVYACTGFIETNQLMGRKTWTMLITPTKTYVTYTLTSCNENQFTCSNGDCTDLQNVCNFEVDCKDFTDEQLCNYTQSRPSYYDRQLSGKENLRVNLTLILLRIHELDMEEATLKVSLRAEAMWSDHRVVFHNIHPGNATLIPTKDAAFYWQPNIVIDGVISEDDMALSMDAEPEKMYVTADRPGKAATFGGNEVLEHEGRHVVIKHKKEKVVTMTCPLDLFSYPFDVQSCNMTLRLEGKVLPDAEWDPAPEEVLEFTETSLQLFEFIHFKRYPVEEKGNPVLFEVRIARRYGSHLLVTYLPCFMLQLIGLSVFAIPLDDLSNRLTVSISCLIVMAALFTQISSTLPVSADPKMIDVWMFVHVLMLAGVFLAMIAINALPGGRPPPEEDDPQIGKASIVWSIKVSPSLAPPSPQCGGARRSSLRRKANKWTAAMCVLSYLSFVAGVMAYTLTVRQRAFADACSLST